MEGLYKNNAIADYYNTIVAHLINKYIEKRLTLSPHTNIHIMELGAGTGGTTGFVLKAIQSFSSSIQYDYTDISLHFTEHGKNEFSHKYPFCRFYTVDLEKPIDEQSLENEINNIDILFGTNVFHATRNIEQTLHNVKRLLKTSAMMADAEHLISPPMDSFVEKALVQCCSNHCIRQKKTMIIYMRSSKDLLKIMVALPNPSQHPIQTRKKMC